MSEVVTTDEEQTYLKLADGRGWAETSRDGIERCEDDGLTHGPANSIEKSSMN